MWLLPYKNGSTGAKDLADALGVRQIKREGSRFRGSEDKLVINWGSSTSNEEVDKCQVLNKPEAVAIATNKLRFFQHIQQVGNTGEYYVPHPPFWTRQSTCNDYIAAGYKVVCRTSLTGHSGEGIVIAETVDQVVAAPLYTQYMPKKREYRVHVFLGEVVDVQRKARDHNVPEERVNWQVRNHDNGFIYVRDEAISDIPARVLSFSIAAIKAVGLDFGAVDVIYNEREGSAYVLEINTAPGLTGTTLEGYKERFAQFGETYKEVLGTIAPGRRTRNIVVDDFGITPQTVPTDAYAQAIQRAQAAIARGNQTRAIPTWDQLQATFGTPTNPVTRPRRG